MLSYSSAADWWTKKMDPNTVRGTFNWNLLMRVIEAKKHENDEKNQETVLVAKEDPLQQAHEEFIKEVEKSGRPAWMIRLYN